MIKERYFKVHPNVLSCLLHLRLKTELKDVRASSQYADKEKKHSESKARQKRAKGKGKKELPHLSKKAKKTLKETKEIQAEMNEAEAEVDREERASQVSGLHISKCDCKLTTKANGNPQITVCAVFQHSESSQTFSSTVRRTSRHSSVCPFDQCGLLPGSIGSYQRYHETW